MKKILLLLAAVGMIFTACEPANGLDEDNNGNNTEQPGGGDQGEEPIFITDNESDIVVEAKGGTVVVTVSTNLEYSVVIPKEAQSWLSVADTRAIRVEKLTFTIAKNEADAERSAVVKLLNIENNELKSITFIQKEGKDNSLNHIECASNEIIYKTKYGYPVTLYEETGFGGILVSNTYENGIGRLIFDADITDIPYSSFKGCTSIIEIKFPDSVTEIGESAFEGCTSLTSITIPNSVTSIGGRAFSGCTGELIVNCNIPSTSDDGYGAFYCSNFTKVTIGDSVTSIGKNAFRGCTGELTVNCNIPSAGSYEYGAFFGSKFISVTIGDSVTSIGAYAFSRLKSLQSITIGNSVTEIGKHAFSSCSSLTRVEFGNNLTSVGENAFYYCTGEVIVNCNTHGLWWYRVFDGSKFTKLTIGNSVTEIGDSVFHHCTSLTSVTIGNSVTSIGEDAFRYCDSLTSVYCKPTTPPTGGSDMLYSNASDRKIYVPRNSVSAYKAAEYWRDYADYIVGYDFE